MSGLCPSCAEADARWLDTITPGPHQPWPWQPHPLGHLRVEDPNNPHARTSRGAQAIRTVRAQRAVLQQICAREHRSRS